MKQTELAKLMGRKPQYICAMMNGHRRASVELAVLLEEKTGIPWTVWLRGTTEEKKRMLAEVEG